MAAPSTVTSGPTSRPPVAAATSLRAQLHGRRSSHLGTAVLAPPVGAAPGRPAPRRPVRSHPMASTDRVRLVVLFGGQSAEHEVSCITAAHVLGAADPERYDVARSASPARARGCRPTRPAPPSPAARPRSPDRPRRPTGTDVEPLPTVTPATGRPARGRPAAAARAHGRGRHRAGPARAGRRALRRLRRPGVGAVHGQGQGQGGPRRRTASPRARTWRCATPSSTDAADARGRPPGSAYPLFVKPANMGSSIGVTKVARRRRAGRRAWRWPPATTSGSWSRRASPPARSRSPCSATPEPRASVPGEIVSEPRVLRLRGQVQRRRLRAAHPRPARPRRDRRGARPGRRGLPGAARATGMARVDFFFEEGGRGFLRQRDQHDPRLHARSRCTRKLWAASGVPYPELIDELVRLAVERHERRRSRVTATEALSRTVETPRPAAWTLLHGSAEPKFGRLL